MEVQQRRARQGAEAQRHASSQRNALQLRPQPAHQAAVAAAAPRGAGGGGQVPSRSRSGSAKRRRRGRPAPEEQSEEEEEKEETGGQALRQARPQWQHPHQHPHQQDASRQYTDAALDKVEAVQSNRKGSDAVLPVNGVAEGLDPETPPAVIYDSDWEERVRAGGCCCLAPAAPLVWVGCPDCSACSRADLCTRVRPCACAVNQPYRPLNRILTLDSSPRMHAPPSACPSITRSDAPLFASLSLSRALYLSLCLAYCADAGAVPPRA